MKTATFTDLAPAERATTVAISAARASSDLPPNGSICAYCCQCENSSESMAE
jgi:hypothetical protein